mgnify:CR=1 FL=1
MPKTELEKGKAAEAAKKPHLRGSGRSVDWRRAALLGFSVLLTGVVFVLLLRQTELAVVGQMLREVRPAAVGVYVLLLLAMYALRACRYRLVLGTLGVKPPWGKVFAVVLVRGTCVDLLPARTGELVYLRLVTKDLGGTAGAATTSFALPFLYDLLALTPLVLLGAWYWQTTREVQTLGLALAAGGLMLLAGLTLRLLPWGLRLGQAVLHWPVIRRLPGLPVAAHFLETTRSGILEARAAGIEWRLFGYSLLVRLCKYGAMYVLLYGLLSEKGWQLADLPFPLVFLGLVSAEMAASLPISGLGGFGAFEGAWALVFQLLLLPADLAAASGIAHNAFSKLVGGSLGVAAYVALLISRRKSA